MSIEDKDMHMRGRQRRMLMSLKDRSSAHKTIQKKSKIKPYESDLIFN